MKLAVTLLMVVMGLIDMSSSSPRNGDAESEAMHYGGRTPRRPVDGDFQMSSVKRTGNNQTFSQSLFEDSVSQKIRLAVLETQFFQKMESNTLPPEQYGGFVNQDAAYCFYAVKSFKKAAAGIENRTLDPDFALFYRIQAASYQSYNADSFVKKWYLKKPGCIILGPAAKTYVEYESNLAEKDPKFLSIGILPCLMLWPWVARDIKSRVPSNGVYRSWVTDNEGSGSPGKAELFVNSKFQAADKVKSQRIFNQGMINELNFFRSACGEALAKYGDFDNPGMEYRH